MNYQMSFEFVKRAIALDLDLKYLHDWHHPFPFVRCVMDECFVVHQSFKLFLN